MPGYKIRSVELGLTRTLPWYTGITPCTIIYLAKMELDLRPDLLDEDGAYLVPHVFQPAFVCACHCWEESFCKHWNPDAQLERSSFNGAKVSFILCVKWEEVLNSLAESLINHQVDIVLEDSPAVPPTAQRKLNFDALLDGLGQVDGLDDPRTLKVGAQEQQRRCTSLMHIFSTFLSSQFRRT